ncbi:Helicase, C-terminal [Dillenia turbinata]|uniref:Helicase, C-terminal n=1 Tax=Dillenia turbinata TaxID=194707 RepID=A0AAN8VIX8_9MAGN
MLMADGNFELWPGVELHNDNGSDDLAFDIEDLIHILSKPANSEGSPEDIIFQGESPPEIGQHDSSLFQEGTSQYALVETDVTFGRHGALNNDADSVSHNENRVGSSIHEVADVVSASNDHATMQYFPYAGDKDVGDYLRQSLSNCLSSQYMTRNGQMMIDINHETEGLSTHNEMILKDQEENDQMMIDINHEIEGLSTHSEMILKDREENAGSELLINRYPGVKDFGIKCEGMDHISPTIGGFFGCNDRTVANQQPALAFPCSEAYMAIKKETVKIQDEKNGGLAVPAIVCNLYSEERAEDMTKFFLGVAPPMPIDVHAAHADDEKKDMFLASDGSSDSFIDINEVRSEKSSPFSGHEHFDMYEWERFLRTDQPYTSTKEQMNCNKDERVGEVIQSKSMVPCLSEIRCEHVQNSSTQSPQADDDDVLIIDDFDQPACSNSSLVHGKFVVTSQHSSFSDPQCLSFSDPPHQMVVMGPSCRTNDERSIYRAALQDLSQPKSETTPPDGVLAVPLLRHQRIALSWMVQKETTCLHCSGGILADDQGLGKTISTIALILKERSPRSYLTDIKQVKPETLNLDEDDERSTDLDGVKPDWVSGQVIKSECLRQSINASEPKCGRPAAGTLVVCPTSVLRQWADELHNKVTGEANLSVLVYHGTNRTKDPWELAKYDVVLTTYSIVSMEVPKRSLVDEDDDEKKKVQSDIVPSSCLSKKRKYPSSSNKRCSKSKKGMDDSLLEAVARPLARVGWFRVVLDEAQSIKNYRTQVARACWGLRAKRRWCLSGTPIQNAIDDLYSYFRFLRYDPYAVYNTFCSMIKVPITKNPVNGYRKLQAVLKTIMLRRTKGTLLDGKPIISLPPKFITLKKVDFSEEERDFYSRLEADSRAQFEEYAAAGTVKDNYVNILLMLLRLRQACDHPLLVREHKSSSAWRSSVDVAKKLHQDKQNCLLDLLEASLAICGICNDPPEDAVVTICGHVFCNQCISEHLTGDDSRCPSSNCKIHLNNSSLFSKSALKAALSDLPCQYGSPDSSGYELVETPGSCYSGSSFDSSKIKAALEVLQSLSKPKLSESSCSSLIIRSASNSSDSLPGESHYDLPCDKSLTMGQDFVNSSAKVGEKAIVFSQWTRMLDLLEDCLKTSSIQYRRLDGTMSVVARDKAVKDFNTMPEVTVMIMSLKAASLGLNMVAACHVLLLDLWWNPTTEDQAIDRAHRIGQTHPVTVLRLTVRNTVEDRILALQQKKREMVASAFGEDETGSRQMHLTIEDLKYLFMA